MCTLSWCHSADQYDLFFNRDEQTTRGPADLPVVRERDGQLFIAPRDPQSGGTWISVNPHGVSVCLLNRYEANVWPVSDRRISRGTLVWTLADARSINNAVGRFQEFDLERTAPFTMVIVEPNRPATLLAWNGFELRNTVRDRAGIIQTSSAVGQPEVERIREQTLRTTLDGDKLTTDILTRFHASHIPNRGPMSVCMHRPDAHTVAFSHVRVSTAHATFEHVPGPPCENMPLVVMSLPRSLPSPLNQIPQA